MNNEKNQQGTTQDTSAINAGKSSATENNENTLDTALNEHFPLSGNETDEDLSRALSSDDDDK